MKFKKRHRSPSLERPVTPLLQPHSAHKRRPSYLEVPSPSDTSSVSSTGCFSAPPTPARISPARSPHEVEEVCYGTIKDVKVLLKWEPKSDEIQKTREDLDRVDGAYRVLRLNFQKDHCLVHTDNGDAVGVLEDRALRVLTQLIHVEASQDNPPIKAEAVISDSQWQEHMMALPNHGRKGQPVTVDVDMFGPRGSSGHVGMVLGRGQMFLQRPCRRLLPPYENPQCLEISVVRSAEPCASQLMKIDAGVATSAFDEAMAMGKEEEGPQLEDIMDNIYSYDYEETVDVDHRITTSLRSYQKEAVQFISKRESGNALANRSLWDPLGNEQDAIGYQHAITGAKSRTADDAPGGILADAMGLGKTLTMIAVIAGSLDKAIKLAQDKNNEGQPRPLESQSAGLYHTRATLVVVPAELLLASWTDEIKTHTAKDSISYHVYHGRDRIDDASIFCQFDIVLTTYGTLTAELARGQGTLHKVHWYRVILDEAHIIRNWSTKQFGAVHDIQAHIRWCMTGTPIQNRLEDLGSLVRFLKLPILGDAMAFRKYICAEVGLAKPMAKKDFSNLRLLLGSICLRRTQAVLKLQSATEVVRPTFSETEWNAYRTMEVVCKQAIEVAVNSKRAKVSHQNVLEKILRLREFCNGITVDASDSPEAVFSMMQQTGETLCAYCTTDIKELDAVDGARRVQLTECRRFVCNDRACSLRYQEVHDAESRCPFCRIQHKVDDILTERDEARIETKQGQMYPTKLLTLLKDVRQHARREKCIVFSVWKRTLNILESLFNDHGIKYCRLDGSVPTTKQRKNILLDFQQRPEIKVLLMTFGTGAVGLNNLSVASRIHLLEPQWNPSIERQAIGRVLRLGQEKEVKILRYVMRGSIEEVVEGRQHHKSMMASGGFSIAQLAKEMRVTSSIAVE